jgi:hypothetical protein
MILHFINERIMIELTGGVLYAYPHEDDPAWCYLLFETSGGTAPKEIAMVEVETADQLMSQIGIAVAMGHAYIPFFTEAEVTE